MKIYKAIINVVDKKGKRTFYCSSEFTNKEDVLFFLNNEVTLPAQVDGDGFEFVIETRDTVRVEIRGIGVFNNLNEYLNLINAPKSKESRGVLFKDHERR